MPKSLVFVEATDRPSGLTHSAFAGISAGTREWKISKPHSSNCLSLEARVGIERQFTVLPSQRLTNASPYRTPASSIFPSIIPANKQLQVHYWVWIPKACSNLSATAPGEKNNSGRPFAGRSFRVWSRLKVGGWMKRAHGLRETAGELEKVWLVRSTGFCCGGGNKFEGVRDDTT